MTSWSATRLALAAVVLLGVIAWLSPDPGRVTDRGIYEATAARGVVPDCSDLHCFRVLVAWTLGALPGESEVKWTSYAVAANAAAAVAVLALGLTLGLPRRAAVMAAAMSALGFGSLYTLHDPFTSDPLMFVLAPVVMYLALQQRVMTAGIIAALGVLAKEFVAAPLYILTAVMAAGAHWQRAAHVLVAANTAFLVWLALQLTLIIGFNYSYGDNPSTHLLSGGYLTHWVEQQSVRGVLASLFNVYGAAYLLAAAGTLLAPPLLLQLTLAAVPVAVLFAYVQQPDRALWNFHFLVLPLAALTLERLPAAFAWSIVALFALGNLRVGAQLTWVPDARFALVGSTVMAAAAVSYVWMARRRLTQVEGLA